MARSTSTSAVKKEPGRVRQMWQVFQMTRRYDSRAVSYIAGSVALPLLAGIAVGILFSGGSVFTEVLWIIAGALAGLLLGLLVLGRRAERAAYSQIEGQPGAVGAVLRSSLKRGWRGSEMPIAVNARSQDAVYRAVGRGGVVLISEGPQSRTAKMVDEERRRISRVLPNVPVTTISVGPDPESVPLHKVSRALSRIKPKLTKSEVMAVSDRLSSLKSQMPIPKGVDPAKARPQRAR